MDSMNIKIPKDQKSVLFCPNSSKNFCEIRNKIFIFFQRPKCASTCINIISKLEKASDFTLWQTNCLPP